MVHCVMKHNSNCQVEGDSVNEKKWTGQCRGVRTNVFMCEKHVRSRMEPISVHARDSDLRVTELPVQLGNCACECLRAESSFRCSLALYHWRIRTVASLWVQLRHTHTRATAVICRSPPVHLPLAFVRGSNVRVMVKSVGSTPTCSALTKSCCSCCILCILGRVLPSSTTVGKYSRLLTFCLDEFPGASVSSSPVIRGARCSLACILRRRLLLSLFQYGICQRADPRVHIHSITQANKRARVMRTHMLGHGFCISILRGTTANVRKPFSCVFVREQ